MEAHIKFKVLIADDSIGGTRFMDFLEERGFEVRMAGNGTDAKRETQAWHPHFIIYDLILEEFNAQQFLIWARESEKTFGGVKPKVIVTSRNSIVKNIKEVLTLGAIDYMVRPFKFEELLSRLVFHIQSKREISAGGANAPVKVDGGDLYLNLMDIVLREALSSRPEPEVLYNMSKMMGITLKAVRCSIVHIAEDRTTGAILASSDDKKGDVRGMVLDMNKYPEMLHVMTTQKSIVIEDMEYDPQLAEIKKLVKGISFNSMILCPIVKNGETFGVISCRMAKEHSKFSDRDIRFILLTSQVMSLFLNRMTLIPHELTSNDGQETSVIEVIDKNPDIKKVS